MPSNSYDLAAIDLGSNSFHMVIMRIQNDQPIILDRLKEMVRLGDGLAENGELKPEAAARALACLERFGQRLTDMPLGSVRAVGTNTLRRAKNSATFIQQAEDALGHPIEIIAGREEARLIYLGVAHTDLDTGERRLVIDIGGGSTEVIVGQGYTPEFMESMPLGCVSITQGFFADGILSRETLRLAENEARLETRPYEYAFRHHRWQRAVGSSGSAKALANVCNMQGWCEAGTLTQDGMERIRKAIIKAGHIDNLQLTGMSDERRPVFVGGYVVMQAVFDAFNIKEMHISEGALREGLIFERLDRERGVDVSCTTLERLQRDFRVDRAHALRIAETAQQLFAQAATAWGLELERDGNLLRQAAMLHELGMMIAHTAYHEHAAYILDHADMPGFSQPEQQRLASIVRGHRRRLRRGWLNEQPQELRIYNLRLLVLLRLAVTFHRSRSPRNSVPVLDMAFEDNQLRLGFPDGWLDRHPLTRSDLLREAEYLAPHLLLSVS
jgi:exopolyphosphatase/guanosine-5'-triphosphate,3'-diphosphate pyrophosphatase